MVNSIDNISGNNPDSEEYKELGLLFANARQNQPELIDYNINKAVINSLPSKLHRPAQRSLWFDFFGLIVGLFATLLLLDTVPDLMPSLGSLVSLLLEVSPQSITITPIYLGVISMSLILLSLVGWYSVER